MKQEVDKLKKCGEIVSDTAVSDTLFKSVLHLLVVYDYIQVSALCIKTERTIKTFQMMCTGCNPNV